MSHDTTQGRALTLVPPSGTAQVPATVEEAPTVPHAVTALVTKAKGYVIKHPDVCKDAKTTLQDMRKLKTDIEADRDAQLEPIEAYIAPFVVEIDKIKNKAGLGLTLLTQNIKTLTQLVFDYEEKQRRLADQKQEKINQDFAGKVEVAQANAEAKGLPLPALPTPKVVVKPAKTEKMEDGSSLTIATEDTFTIPGVEEKERLPFTDSRAKNIHPRHFIFDWTGVGKMVRSGGGTMIAEESKGIVLSKKPKLGGTIGGKSNP